MSLLKWRIMTDLPHLETKLPRFWFTLISGIIFSCLVMNAVTILYQRGMFRSWISLASPLSGTKRIIDANFNQVWVETQDSHFFTAEILSSCEDQNSCRNWESI